MQFDIWKQIAMDNLTGNHHLMCFGIWKQSGMNNLLPDGSCQNNITPWEKNSVSLLLLLHLCTFIFWFHVLNETNKSTETGRLVMFCHFSKNQTKMSSLLAEHASWLNIVQRGWHHAGRLAVVGSRGDASTLPKLLPVDYSAPVGIPPVVFSCCCG